MSSLAWLIVFLVILTVLSIAVYAVVVKAYYWGDKDGPPPRKGDRGGPLSK